MKTSIQVSSTLNTTCANDLYWWISEITVSKYLLIRKYQMKHTDFYGKQIKKLRYKIKLAKHSPLRGLMLGCNPRIILCWIHTNYENSCFLWNGGNESSHFLQKTLFPEIYNLSKCRKKLIIYLSYEQNFKTYGT